MKISDINEFSTAVKQLTSTGKSTGPRSPDGKLRSSLNAVRHGLTSQYLLLPGDDAESYKSRMDGIFTALSPIDEAQAQIAALVGDDLLKLDRLARIEQGVILGRIEELLGVTEASAKAKATAAALMSLGTAIRSWEQQPFPAEKNDEFSRRLAAMNDALEVVQNLAPTAKPDLVKAAIEVLNGLFDSVGKMYVPSDAFTEMRNVAGKLMAALLDEGERDEAAQQKLRTAIAAIALPDEAELKKLGRYRKMLEEGLHRRLQALEQLRKLAATSPVTADTSEKAREYRVKLRVVA